MDHKKMKDAIIEWKETGSLTTDKELVLEMRDLYARIKEFSCCVPQYELMFHDACSEHSRLCDIIKARGYDEHVTYILNWGDTLSKISVDFDVSMEEIARLNPKINNLDKIYAGDTLILPRKKL